MFQQRISITGMTFHKNYGKDATSYPAPIVDYKTAKEEMIQMYKKAK